MIQSRASSGLGPVAMLVDALPSDGLGHLARCRALALALRDRGIGTLAILEAPLPDAVVAWQADFDDVWVVDDSRQLERARDCPVVLIDSYRLVPADAPPDARRVVIDDGPPRSLQADLIVNPNLGAAASDYPSVPGTEVLAGPAHALLRPELLPHRDAVSARPDVRRVLVTCGATDPTWMTERYLDALDLVEGPLDVRVVVGPANSRLDAITRRAAAGGRVVVPALDDLSAIEAWADMALTTLGVTAAELAYLGVTNLTTAVDERQLPHLARYAEMGFVVGLGWHGDLTPELIAAHISELRGEPRLREALRAASRAAVDGRGAGRVATAIAKLASR